ncbi:MAG: hypothetical protein ACXAB2_10980 [Candidatus Hodarchaeales archaeon]
MEMHELVVFGLIVNIISRLIGAIVAFDMFTKTKENRHFQQLVGWIFLLLSAFSPLGITLTQDLFIVNLFRIINVICLNIGLYLLITGLSMYFTKYPRNIIVSALLTIIIVPIFVFILLDVSIAVNISVFFQFLIIMSFLTQVYSNRKEIKNILQYSYGLIVLLMILLVGYIIVNIYVITSVPDYSYGLFMITDSIAIMANYASVAMVTLLGLMLFLHLEQGIYLKKKNLLKDEYSHKIGNILQIILGAGTTIKALSDSREVDASTNLILERSEEAGELIRKIREM